MKSRDTPVFIVTNSNSGGGAERSMNLLCKELDKLGLNIHLVNINSSAKDFIAPNVVTHQLGRRRQAGLLETIKALVRFQLIVWRNRPSRIILNCEISELLGSLILRRRGLIILQHSPNPWNGRKPLGLLIRTILRLKVVTWVALRSNDPVWPFSFRSSHHVPNLIHLPRQIPMDSKRVISRLVFIGRMHTEKRPDWFIKIAEKVHLPAVLIGDGDKFEEISRMCVDRYPFVFLLGHVLNPWSHIAHGDLLIVTSDYEGDGLVVYEALSAGIPVLLRDIPDLKRLNLSSLNYCSSIEEFADRVKKFKENYSEILPSDQIKDLLLKEREISQITSKWISILND